MPRTARLPGSGRGLGEFIESARDAVAEHVKIGHGAEVADVTVRGHPVKALVHASGGADLVVVAAHGHSNARIGSVSHGLIHHAECPVAVVRPRE